MLHTQTRRYIYTWYIFTINSTDYTKSHSAQKHKDCFTIHTSIQTMLILWDRMDTRYTTRQSGPGIPPGNLI